MPLIPRQPFVEDDSILDPSFDFQYIMPQHGDYQFLPGDDAGIDEFEVAEERAHLFGE